MTFRTVARRSYQLNLNETRWVQYIKSLNARVWFRMRDSVSSIKNYGTGGTTHNGTAGAGIVFQSTGQLGQQEAISYNGQATDLVTISANANLNNDIMSFIVCVKPTGTGERSLFQFGNANTYLRILTANILEFRVQGTTDARAISTTTLPDDTWSVVVAQINWSTDKIAHIYIGNESGFNEVNYSTTHVTGVGTRTSMAGQPLIVGNQLNATRPLEGDLDEFIYAPGINFTTTQLEELNNRFFG